MNKITKLFLFIFLLSHSLNAQLIVGESGSVEIKNGASIEVAGLEINPAADYVINSNTSVTSDLAPLTINGAESMARHYDAVAPLSDFIGTIVFNYNEEDMNGISHEADLQVLDSEGGSWTNYADADDTDFSVTHVFDTSVNIHSVTASAMADPQTAVTFTVNTANIEVGPNGIYLGGGVFNSANAHAMSDADGDGTWEVTVNLDQGITGNYIFLNSPNDGGDWGAKEVLNGQECADPANYDDRILPEITGSAMTIQHCFGSCESDGTCPAPASTSDVTFSVDTSNYPGGLADTDQLYVSGSLNGWCGDCNPMSDDDGDGIWEVTIALEDGDYEYKFTINNWAAQEEFSEAVEGCTVTDGTYTNRSLTVAGQDLVLPTVFWNLCAGETPGEVYNVTFNLDATAVEVGANGMYMGGGILGGANGVAMSDDDGDGIWSVTIEVSTDQIGGNYTFLNSPNDGGDWSAKEDISGQDCADADNFNDRIVPEFSGDAEFCYVFAVCTDGVCAEPADPDCSFEVFMAAPGSWPSEITWEIQDADGAVVLSGNADSTDVQILEMSYGETYTLVMNDSFGDGWNGGEISVNGMIYTVEDGAQATASIECTAPAPDCTYDVFMAAPGSWPSEITWEIQDADGAVVLSGNADSTDVQILEASDGETYTLVMNDSFGDGWNGGEISVNGMIYTVEDGAQATVSIVCDALSITDNDEVLEMRIYPNPVDGNYVTIQSPAQGLKEIEVFTLTGRKILQTVLTDDQLDVSSFNSGFYMVKVTINGESKLSKLVVR
jgi:hypothetical protein